VSADVLGIQVQVLGAQGGVAGILGCQPEADAEQPAGAAGDMRAHRVRRQAAATVAPQQAVQASAHVGGGVGEGAVEVEQHRAGRRDGERLWRPMPRGRLIAVTCDRSGIGRAAAGGQVVDLEMSFGSSRYSRVMGL
jgi:hypothetical protein